MGQGRLILVAEDDPAQQEILEEVLTGEGYRVLLAQNPVELMEQLVHAPDAVLMDVVGVLSPGVMRALMALHRRPGILLVSGENSLAQTAARMRADGFLCKPYELHTLLELLARVSRSTGHGPQEELAQAASAPL